MSEYVKAHLRLWNEKKVEESETLQSSKSEIGWGHQKDHTYYNLTNCEDRTIKSTNPKKILDGEIDEFLERSLYQI